MQKPPKKGGGGGGRGVVGSKRPFCNVSALKMVILGGFCFLGKGTAGGMLKNVKKHQKTAKKGIKHALKALSQ